MEKIRLGISPCPNDTFAFYYLLKELHRELPFEIDLVIADVEELNQRVLAHELHISKVSFYLYGHVRNAYRLLDSGSAMGRGCGPLLLAASPLRIEQIARSVTALPGRFTTAAMLFRLFMASYGFRRCRTELMNFALIADAVASGRTDAGVIIHETRFTYRERGLHLIQDLGQWWEDTTHMPLPLGGIVASRKLPAKTVEQFSHALRESINHATNHPGEALEFCARHAQEMAPDVMKQHIGLYVNSLTLDLGEEGRRAVEFMIKKGERHGLFNEPEKTQSACEKRS